MHSVARQKGKLSQSLVSTCSTNYLTFTNLHVKMYKPRTLEKMLHVCTSKHRQLRRLSCADRAADVNTLGDMSAPQSIVNYDD